MSDSEPLTVERLAAKYRSDPPTLRTVLTATRRNSSIFLRNDTADEVEAGRMWEYLLFELKKVLNAQYECRISWRGANGEANPMNLSTSINEEVATAFAETQIYAYNIMTARSR